MLDRVVAALVLAAASADSGAGKPSPSTIPSSRCVACSLLTKALGDALAETRKELDVFKEAKEEAIGRVQKAQTKRWLKQEYGSTLYAGVEDALDKVCALPALSDHKRACESIREEREDELVRATLDDTAPAFCDAHVPSCGPAQLEAIAAERAARAAAKASSKASGSASKSGSASEPIPKPTRTGAKPPAVTKAVADSWESLVLDGARDVLVFVHASASTGGAWKGAANHKGTPLWSAYVNLAKAVRADAGLNATLSYTRIDISLNDVRWPEGLFEPAARECAPAVVLYSASAKETPRALASSCDADSAAAAGGTADSDAAGAVQAAKRHISMVVEGLRTYVTATSKAAVGKLVQKATERLEAAGALRDGASAKDEL
jgi:hypothetical protein